MGGEDDAGVVLRDRLHQVTQEVATGKRVEAGDRFVEDEQLGPLGDGDGEGELGTLSAGELARLLLRLKVEPFDTGLRKLGIPAGIQLGAELEVIGDGQARVGRSVLGDVADPRQLGGTRGGLFAEHLDSASGRREHPAGDLQQGGLARAVGPDQADDMPRRDRPGCNRPAPDAARSSCPARGSARWRSFLLFSALAAGVLEHGLDARLGQARGAGLAPATRAAPAEAGRARRARPRPATG